MTINYRYLPPEPPLLDSELLPLLLPEPETLYWKL